MPYLIIKVLTIPLTNDIVSFEQLDPGCVANSVAPDQTSRSDLGL